MKKIIVATIATLAAGVVLAAPASAGEDDVCSGLSSGKIDVGGGTSVTVSAPSGYVIDGYCVKAGSANQGNGPQYVTVNPPVESVTFGHSTGKDISHYSVSWVAKPSPSPSPTPTPTETPSPSPSPTPTETPVATPEATPAETATSQPVVVVEPEPAQVTAPKPATVPVPTKVVLPASVPAGDGPSNDDFIPLLIVILAAATIAGGAALYLRKQ